jgi:hypothetical protein
VRPARAWLVASALGVGMALSQHAIAASPDWKKEFEEVCAKTQDAMALPVEELKSLVSRCDKLKPQIEKLDETQRKVYSRRLQVCRDLYQFVIESREKG